jgi:hypothetical protein
MFRSELTCAAPEDVWIEPSNGAAFVTFSLVNQPQKVLGFAVDRRSHEVIDVGIVSVAVVNDEWQIKNEGSTRGSGESSDRASGA